MKLPEYLKLIRVKDWKAYILISFLGFILANNFSLSNFVGFLALISLYLSYTFSINECFDLEEDRLKKKTPLTEGTIALKNAILFSVSFAVLSLFICLILFPRGLSFYLLLLTLSTLYSVKPFKLKSRPLLDIISHGLFFGSLLFLLPLIIFSKINNLFLLVSFSIFLASINFELRNHLRDFDFDEQAGVKTTAVFLGKKNTQKIILLINLVTSLILLYISFLVNAQWFLLASILITTVFIFTFFKKKNHKLFEYYLNAFFALFILAFLW